MRYLDRTILVTVLTGLFMSSVLWASQPPSRIKIDFEKLPKVKLAQKTLIKIKLEALEQVENVDIDISLPAYTTLLNGNTKHNKAFMQKGERSTYILQISVDDSVMDRIVVRVVSEKDGIRYQDNADLYFVSYGGTVELLTQEEISDQSQRIWKAPKLVAGSDYIKVIPISYEDSFIQLEPDLEGIEDTVNYVFEDGKPFVTRGPTKVETPGGLGKGTQAASITVTISGTVNFWDSNNQSHSFANGTVEFWDDDVWWDDHLGSTTTNASGYFSKTVSGTDGWFDSEIEIYLKIKTSNSKVRVYNQNGNMYNFVNGTVQTSGGTINWGTVTLSWGSYAACSIFNWMNESWNFTNNNGYDPGLIRANYPNSAGSYFSRSNNRIYIESSDWIWSAEDVTRHEYGHNLMYNAQGGWWPPNTGGGHTFTSTLHENFAWTEGWGTAFTQFVDPDGFYSGWFPVEDPNSYKYTVPTGHTNEGRVAAALSDLYDSNQDGDDYASITYSKIISTIRNNNNDHLIEFWDNLKPTLSQSDKHYASRALIYNTINVPLEPLPDPLSVTISGPWSLGYKESGTFTANVSGGSGTIYYQWYRQNEGSSYWQTRGTYQSQLEVMINKSFTMKMVVTRGSETDEATKYVRFEGGGGPIPKQIAALPQDYALSQNHPNPFNPVTTIVYQLPVVSGVTLVIYDLLGSEVMKWVMEQEQPGYKRVLWEGRDSNGQLVPAGVYIYRLTARATESKQIFRQTRKMVLLK
ncbi:MAG: T9SS type A sorting domain-containing protein [Candidatus Marinimicrobia bacterium]|nr:T9SS type A sorting domain-containing protein [Candidatus Neomarinimicrobiota bacterium]